MKYAVLNFAYGTGPYLRTTKLALEFNEELSKRGQEKLGIVVPWVYGEKQRKVMIEEFSGNAEQIFLDPKLGSILKSIFYGNSTYQETLIRWSRDVRKVSAEAREHLSGKIALESLADQKVEVEGKDIIVELNRSARVRYDVAPAYASTFGYIAEILENLPSSPLMKAGIEAANWVEDGQRLHAVAYPGTFSWKKDYKPRYSSEILTPPVTREYPANDEDIEPGIFVTITGIPGLERLYEEARSLSLKFYSNDTEAVPGSVKKLPYVVPNKNIIFQFARAGWGSVWLSMMSGTPIVVPEYDPADDPEIYFNNIAVEKLGIGIVYRGQPLEEIMAKTTGIKENCRKLCKDIMERFGMLDGNQYFAQIIVKDFLRL